MSYLVLGTKIYRHQQVSMIISPILSIAMFIVFIKDLGFEFKLMLYLIICLGLRTLRFILMVFGKLYMEKYYVTQAKLLTFFGIFGLIFSLSANLISNFFKFQDYYLYNDYLNSDKRFTNIFDYYKIMNKLYFYCSIILWFIENNLIWFCISNFSPNHYIIYRNINSILVILKDLIFDDQFNFKGIDLKVIISFISLVGNFFCGLMFNEIIIIKKWKLDKYTLIEINKRQKEEFHSFALEIGNVERTESLNNLEDENNDSDNKSNK